MSARKIGTSAGTAFRREKSTRSSQIAASGWGQVGHHEDWQASSKVRTTPALDNGTKTRCNHRRSSITPCRPTRNKVSGVFDDSKNRADRRGRG
jgi:hypothetical protein